MSVDLGTANTLIFVRGQGIVLHEPSVVAIRQFGNHSSIVAVGTEAKRMLGRTPDNIVAIRPLKDGVIADFEVTEHMLTYFIRKVHENSVIRPSPQVMICVPCRSTGLERRAIRESAESAGARTVRLIEEPMAAAIGAGLPVHEAVGTMIVDIGGGTTEIAVISLGGVVYADSVRIGGDRCNEAIVSYVRKTRRALIGDVTAERIKHEIGGVHVTGGGEEILEMQVVGRSLTEGVPTSFVITSAEIFEALGEILGIIVQSAKNVLEKTPPELTSDIGERGLVLTGGGALMKGIDTMLSTELGLPVTIAEDPLTCVVRGTDEAWKLTEQGGDYSLFSIIH